MMTNRVSEVMTMLRPTGGWVTLGDDFGDVTFPDCTPVTIEEYNSADANFDAWKSEQTSKQQGERQALLARLGITEEEAKLLLS